MMAIRTILLACLVATCVAVKHEVDWKVALAPKTLEVACGDTIAFTWAGTHDVAKSTTGSCTGESNVIAEEKTGGKYTYTVGKKDTTFYFICTVAGHCAAGQKLMVTSTCGAANATTIKTNGTSTKTNTTTNTTLPTKAGTTTNTTTTTPTTTTTNTSSTTATTGAKTNGTTTNSTKTNGTKSSAPLVSVSLSSFVVAAIVASIGALLL